MAAGRESAQVVEPCTTPVRPGAVIVPPCTTIVQPRTMIVPPCTTIVQPCTTIVQPRTMIVPPRTRFVRPCTTIVRPCARVVHPRAGVVRGRREGARPPASGIGARHDAERRCGASPRVGGRTIAGVPLSGREWAGKRRRAALDFKCSHESVPMRAGTTPSGEMESRVPERAAPDRPSGFLFRLLSRARPFGPRPDWSCRHAHRPRGSSFQDRVL
jgi:hypothetical protein